MTDLAIVMRRAARLALVLAALPPSGARAVTKAARVDKPRLTIIGIDAGEWSAVDYLRGQGEMPNLDRLIRDGASGPLESIDPLFTPIVWTTIATGKPPLLHGIRGFKVVNPETGRKVPVNRTMRTASAIWGILSKKGLSTLVTAWYATWPAEAVNGTMISDYTWPLKNVEESEHFLETRLGVDLKDQTFPAAVYERVRDLFLDKNADNAAFLRRFGLAPKDAPYALKHSYAKDMTYFRIYRRLRAAKDYDFTTLYIQGADLLSHQFFREFSLLTRGRLKPGARGWREAVHVARYYRLVDQIIGVYLEKVRKPGETVLIVSDHGFEDKGRPVLAKVSDDRYDRRRYWHRREGLLIANGPRVRRGARITGASIFDVAPTVLAHFGLPLARDMQGRPLEDVVPAASSAPRPVVATYESKKLKAAAAPAKIRESAYDEAILKRLNDLGYIQ